MIFSKIVGVGGYLPPKTVENSEIERELNLGDWIFERTGIMRRHISEGESATEMGIKSLTEALERSGMPPDRLEYVLVVSNSPDRLIPGMAGGIQKALGTKIGGVDIQAGCSGFIQAIEIADSMIRSGTFSTVAVVGTERLSRIVDWKDRAVSPLFGDGAGSVVIAGSEKPGIIASYSRIQGDGAESLIQEHGKYLEMDGRTVFRFAVDAIAEGIEMVLERAEMTMEDIDLIVPHQSNSRIISRVASQLGIQMGKFQLSIEEHANTAAASVALALKDAVDSKRIGSSSTVLSVAYGAGLGIASSIFKL